MLFIKVTNSRTGLPMLINTANIAYIIKYSDNRTIIHFTTYDPTESELYYLIVKESYEEISEVLRSV